MSPASSPSFRGVNVAFVVTVKDGAGNFCSSKLGTSQKFLKSGGNETLNNRRKPKAPDANAQFDCGLACHCHWSPILLPLNSSESAGVFIGYVLPTFGFR